MAVLDHMLMLHRGGARRTGKTVGSRKRFGQGHSRRPEDGGFLSLFFGSDLGLRSAFGRGVIWRVVRDLSRRLGNTGRVADAFACSGHVAASLSVVAGHA